MAGKENGAYPVTRGELTFGEISKLPEDKLAELVDSKIESWLKDPLFENYSGFSPGTQKLSGELYPNSDQYVANALREADEYSWAMFRLGIRYPNQVRVWSPKMINPEADDFANKVDALISASRIISFLDQQLNQDNLMRYDLPDEKLASPLAYVSYALEIMKERIHQSLGMSLDKDTLALSPSEMIALAELRVSSNPLTRREAKLILKEIGGAGLKAYRSNVDLFKPTGYNTNGSDDLEELMNAELVLAR